MYVPPLLWNLLVVIPFHWDLTKVNLLRLTVGEVAIYEQFTNVDTVIITDNVASTANAIATFNIDKPPQLWEYNSSSPYNQGGRHDMLWEHRLVIETHFALKNYTAFLYMEDDTSFPWPQLVSWAIDTEILEPLGFTRGIFRTEINEAGLPSMNDMVVNLMQQLGCSMNLTVDTTNPKYVRSLDVKDLSGVFSETEARLASETCFPATNSFNWLSAHHKHSRSPSLHSPTAAKEKHTACAPHRRFMQMYSPFHGLTVLSRSQQEKFMKHPFWRKGDAMKISTLRSGQKYWNWGPNERSNSINVFVDPPPGWFANTLVPYTVTHGAPALSPYARVEHLRNAYKIVCTPAEALVF